MSKPSSPVAYADITAPTNQNVTVYATFDETAVVCKYAIDTPSSWYDYTENGVVLSKNGKVYFACTNANDEGSDMTTFEVTNIDKVAPDAPVVSVESAASFDGVIVSAAFSKDSVVQEYSFEGQRWIQYEGAISVMNADTEIFFRATDAAGNESFAEYKAENFPVGGNEGLDAPVARASTTEPTNTDVFVTAIFDSDAAVNQFSTDGQTWEEYADGINGIPFAENGTVSFRSLDAAGSASPTTTYEVTNIDKIPPDAPVISVTQADTFEGVIVSAAFSKDSVYQEYSFEGKKWMQYEGAISVMESGTVVLFRATDAAGNESTTTYEFTGATGGETGLAAPTVTADILAFTNTDVVLSVTYSDEAFLKEYSLDRQIWLAFPTDGAATPPVSGGTTTITDSGDDTMTGGTRSVIPADGDAAPVTLTVTANGTYYFRGTTADGIVSDVTSFTVRNIDKVAPTAPTGLNSWTTENADGSVTLTFGWSESTDDYSGIGKYIVSYWQNGSGNITTVETTDKQFSIDFPAPIPSSATGDDGTPIDVDGTVGSSDVTPALASVQVDPSDWSWSVQAVDAAGNLSEAAVLDNGPKIAAPVAIAGNTEPTNMDVYVTARFDETAAVNEYSLDGQTWLPYPEEPVFTGGPIAVSISENGTVYFRSMDADGNYSAVTEIIINNIDKVAPDAPVAFADITEPTNQNVTVYARFSEDSVMRSYAVVDAGSGNWQVYDESTGVVLEYNDTIRFSCVDAAGNYSPVTTFVVSNIDKVAPTKPTVTVTAANLPAGKGLDIAAAFSEDSVKQEYSFDGTTWLEYSGAITVTEVGKKLYFRGTDAAGNVSNSAFYLVDKLSLAPAAPVAYADITEPTNQDVTVYATFDETATVRKYAINTTSSWYDYTDAGVVLTQNGTVYFACVDADGEGSDMTTFVVSNIDKVAPEAPRASADVTEDTDGIVTVSAAFSEDSVTREYSLDGETWQAYTDPIRFERNGMVWFRATDAVGNISNSLYPVDNIYEPVDQESYADDGWNDWAINNTTGAVNEDLNSVLISPEYEFKDEVLIDKKHSIDVDGWHNFVGTDEAGNVDSRDFVRLLLDENMRLCFTVTASEKASINLVALTQSVNNDGRTVLAIRSLLFKALKKDKETGLYTLTTDIQLEANSYDGSKYFLAVNPSSKKKSVFYNVELERGLTEFYRYGNNDDDGGLEKGEYNEIQMDQDFHVEGWVGFGDTVDFYKFTLDHAAKLNFGVVAGTYLDFDLYEIADKNGKQTLKKIGKTLSLKSELVEMPERGKTGLVTLDAGDYFFSVKCFNSQKCGEEEINYIIQLAPDSVFYDVADDGWNNWVTKAVSKNNYVLNTEITNADEVLLDETCDAIQLDREGSVEKNFTYFDSLSGLETDDVYTNYVGIGDLIDYKKVSLGVAANLSFSIHASDVSTFTIYRLERNKLGAYSLKALQTTKVKGNTIAGEFQAKTKRLLLEAGDYYISMQTTKKNEAFYSVYVYDNDDDREHSTVFFRDAIGGDVDDWSVKTGPNNEYIRDHIVELAPNNTWIVSDWVGYRDPIDYAGFSISGPAKLVFDVAASDKVKFTVYSLEQKKGKYSLKSVMAATLKENKNAETADEKYMIETVGLLLKESGTYYVSVQSTNAASGGNAYYYVDVNADKSAFFDPAKMNDSGNDNWKTLSAAEEKKHVITQKGTVLEGWVGYGDTIDYYGFSLENNTNVVFSVTATDQAKFTLSAYTERRGKVSLKTVQKKTALKYNSDTGLYEFTMSRTLLSGDTLYYITMESPNAKNGGSADYTVSVETFQPSFASALAMPESPSDVLQDNLFAETSSAISSAVTDALDDKLGSVMNASWTTLA